MQQQLRDQLAEQRRFIVSTVEALGRRMGAEFKDALSKLPPPPTLEIPPPPPPVRWPMAVAALLAAVPALVLGALLWRTLDSNQAAARQIAELKARPAPAPSAQTTVSAAATTAASGARRELATAVEFLP